jgi:hypothetical protein
MAERPGRPFIQNMFAIIAGVIAAVSLTYSITNASANSKVDAVSAKQVTDEAQITEIRIGLAQQSTKFDALINGVNDIKQSFKEHIASSGGK